MADSQPLPPGGARPMFGPEMTIAGFDPELAARLYDATGTIIWPA